VAFRPTSTACRALPFINKNGSRGSRFLPRCGHYCGPLKAGRFAIQIPIGAEDQFKGVDRLVKMRARVWRDETLGAEYDDEEIRRPAGQGESYREQMIEAIAESDDHLFAKFVEGTPISESEIAAVFRKATISQKIFPVICVRRSRTRASRNLLDSVRGLSSLTRSIFPVSKHAARKILK